MLILTKAVLAMMIGFIISVVFGLIFIPLLKKINVKQRVSSFLAKKHKEKNGTPTMGGLIFIIPTLVTCLILLKSPVGAKRLSLFLSPHSLEQELQLPEQPCVFFSDIVKTSQ